MPTLVITQSTSNLIKANLGGAGRRFGFTRRDHAARGKHGGLVGTRTKR